MKNTFIKFITVLITIILITSCSTPNLPTLPVVHQPEGPVYVSIPANATPTKTPFQPMMATATSTPVPTATKTPTPVPTNTPTRTATRTPLPPTPTSEYPEMDGIVNILILGSDERPTGGFRTDTIILLSINPNKGTISAISFPRDLWITIPGYGQERINTVEQIGGFNLMAETFQKNFGVRPTHYVMTNMAGFLAIVDTFGGIDVKVEKNLTDKCSLPIAKKGVCSVGPGVVRMDEVMALWYVRSRYSTNDFDRTRRAQEVMLAIFNKLMSANTITKIPEIYNIYKKNVQTSLKVTDLLPFVPIAIKAYKDQSRIHRYAVGPSEVYNWVTPGGAMVLVPNLAAVRALVQRAINAE
ncbi:MAG TPA: LCP family protein [Anaerolineaceae bacterium]